MSKSKSKPKRIRFNKQEHKTRAGLLAAQYQAFVDRFGRPPGANDPIFFDPDNDVPTPISEKTITEEVNRAFRAAGTPPELVYAFQKTGRMVTEANCRFLSQEELAEWGAAIREYIALEADAAAIGVM